MTEQEKANGKEWKHYVMYKMFRINDEIVLANDIDEAMALFKETMEGKTHGIKKAWECNDGDRCYVKIATEEDYFSTHGKEENI